MSKKCKYYREADNLMYTPQCCSPDDAAVHEMDIDGDYCQLCGKKIKFKEYTKHPENTYEWWGETW